MTTTPNEAWVYLMEGQYTRTQLEELIKMFDLQDEHIKNEKRNQNE